MSLFRVKYLSFFFILISVLSFFNIIYSYYFNFYLNLNTYYISLLSSSLIAILFYQIKSKEKKPSIFEKILTVFLGYILLPLILLIPFYFSRGVKLALRLALSDKTKTVIKIRLGTSGAIVF